MWIYYGMIVISVVMFGGGFAIQDLYREKRGSSLKISMESAFIGSVFGLIVLLAFNKFSLDFTAFTFFIALWAALNGMAFTFCTFKALDYINLSLFSLFAMLGGMVLPFFQGIFFYEEGFTLAKIVCVVFISASLMCTVEKGKGGRGTLFYVGIFILNGMNGVITKLFTSSQLPKTSALEYSIWGAIITIALSGAAWILLGASEKSKRTSRGVHTATLNKGLIIQSYGLGALYGVVNRVANLLLVLALVYVDSSVQYPLVTGGTMIVSTAISFIGKKKPKGKEVVGVALAFLGMCALFFIPV